MTNSKQPDSLGSMMNRLQKKVSPMGMQANNGNKACPRCGSKNNTEDAFCGECGHRFTSAVPAPPVGISPPPTGHKPAVQQDSKFCSQCGSRNDPDSIFCDQCGHRFASAVVSSPGSDPISETIPPPVQGPISKDRDHSDEATTMLNDDDETRLLNEPVIPVLKIQDEGGEQVIPIDKADFIIGRNMEAVDFPIGDNKNVGRTHAKIISRDELYYIVDLDSKNGTYINGERLKSGEPYPLSYKDQIKLANFELIFDEE